MITQQNSIILVHLQATHIRYQLWKFDRDSLNIIWEKQI